MQLLVRQNVLKQVAGHAGDVAAAELRVPGAQLAAALVLERTAAIPKGAAELHLAAVAAPQRLRALHPAKEASFRLDACGSHGQKENILATVNLSGYPPHAHTPVY